MRKISFLAIVVSILISCNSRKDNDHPETSSSNQEITQTDKKLIIKKSSLPICSYELKADYSDVVSSCSEVSTLDELYDCEASILDFKAKYQNVECMAIQDEFSLKENFLINDDELNSFVVKADDLKLKFEKSDYKVPNHLAKIFSRKNKDVDWKNLRILAKEKSKSVSTSYSFVLGAKLSIPATPAVAVDISGGYKYTATYDYTNTFSNEVYNIDLNELSAHKSVTAESLKKGVAVCFSTYNLSNKNAHIGNVSVGVSAKFLSVASISAEGDISRSSSESESIRLFFGQRFNVDYDELKKVKVSPVKLIDELCSDYRSKKKKITDNIIKDMIKLSIQSHYKNTCESDSDCPYVKNVFKVGRLENGSPGAKNECVKATPQSEFGTCQIVAKAHTKNFCRVERVINNKKYITSHPTYTYPCERGYKCQKSKTLKKDIMGPFNSLLIKGKDEGTCVLNKEK